MITHVDGLRVTYPKNGRHRFAGFLNGVLPGEEINIEFYDEIYHVRIISSRMLPSCITPYVVMEVV